MKLTLISLFLPLLVAASPVELEERQAASCARKYPACIFDVYHNHSHSAVSVFFARGTGEPGTNGTIIGPSLEKNLQTALGNSLTYTAILYSAGVSGDIPGGQGPGTTAYVNQLKQVTSKCPNTKVVLTGYSQGAILVHSTAKQYGKPIAAAVTFGDPEKEQTPTGCEAEHYKTFCANGDPVCGAGANLAAHLSYGSDASQAAAFIKQVVS